MIRLTIALCLFVTAVHAEDMVEPWKVIASLTGDWSDDAFVDRAVLVEVEDEQVGPVLDLIIYAENSTTYAFEEVARIHDVAWQGRMWGTRATMILNETGSIQIISGNEAIGRGRWHEILTIAYRDGAYRVAGYYNDYYDTLDLDQSGSCDMNFLTGKGKVEFGEDGTDSFTHTIPALELSQWDRAEVSAECRKYLPQP